MKIPNKQPGLLLFMLFIFQSVVAQKNKPVKEEKFDQALLCPFEHGMGREPSQAYAWDPPDMKVVMISLEDTVIRSCINARVASINPTEDGRYELVIYYKEYYFWYFGFASPLVNNNQDVKAGEILGTYKPGDEMEFRMFKDEVMVDPRKFLECEIKPSGEGRNNK